MRFGRLDLNLLVALDALLTERSVSLAADKLCLSQSATSSALGRLREAEIGRVVTTLGERLCLAERGDVWLYATSIVHASLAADPPRRRRVLQIDFSADATPGPLAWRGV